jgi:hypothetical protein
MDGSEEDYLLRSEGQVFVGRVEAEEEFLASRAPLGLTK